MDKDAPDKLSKLIEEMEKGDRFSQWVVARKLGGLRDRAAVEPLIRCLDREDDVLRRYAAAALGNIADPRATGPLVRCLDSDKEQRVRWEAAISLGKLNNPEAVEPLLRALSDEDEGLRRRAADSLKRLGVGPASLTLTLQAEEELVEGKYGWLGIQVDNNGQGPALGLKVVLSGPFSDKQKEFNVPSRLNTNEHISRKDSILPDRPGHIPLELSVTYRDVAKPNQEILKYRYVSIKVGERQPGASPPIPQDVVITGGGEIYLGPVTRTEHKGPGDILQQGAFKQQEGVIQARGQATPGGWPKRAIRFCPYCGAPLGSGQTPEVCPNPDCGERLR